MCETVLPHQRGATPHASELRLFGVWWSGVLVGGARPVQIITMIKWTRTSRLSIKNSLSLPGGGDTHPLDPPHIMSSNHPKNENAFCTCAGPASCRANSGH